MEKLARRFKGAMVDEVAKIVEENPNLFFVNFQKLPNSKSEKLRNSLKKASVGIKAVKRSILKLALKQRKLDVLCDLAESSSAISFAKKDPVIASKILYDFAKAEENLVINGAYVEGEVLKLDRVKELAMLPPREVLLARVVGGMKAPINGLAAVLRGNMQKLVYVLSAISSTKDKKEEQKGG